MHWRLGLSVMATFLLFSVSNEVKRFLPSQRTDVWYWLLMVTSLLLALVGSSFIWNLSVRLRFVRQLVLGQAWIEGAWIFKTTSRTDKTVVQLGVAQYWYKIPELKLQSVFSNIVLTSLEETSVSPLSIIVDDDLNYTHYFVRGTREGEATGIAAGRFLSTDGREPLRYKGSITYLDTAEGGRYGQVAAKLSDDEIKTYREQFGRDWAIKTLKDDELRTGFLTRV
jgi:hypothetical protein